MSSRLSDTAAILEQVFGAPTYLGTIQGDGSEAKTSQTTDGTPFEIPFGQRLLLQDDNVDFWWIPTPGRDQYGNPTVAVEADPTTAVKVKAEDQQEVCLLTVQNDISIITASEAFSVKVFRLD